MIRLTRMLLVALALAGCARDQGVELDSLDAGVDDVDAARADMEGQDLTPDAADPADACNLGVFYRDGDGDSWGDEEEVFYGCPPGPEWVERAGDCDDTQGDTHPGAEEGCDGIDRDCDGVLAPGFEDSDGDGVRNCADPELFAERFESFRGPAGWSVVNLSGGESPNWVQQSGAYREDSGASHSLALTPDLGTLDTWVMSVRIRSDDLVDPPAANDGAGVAVGFDTPNAPYMLIALRNPTAFGGDPVLEAAVCMGVVCVPWESVTVRPLVPGEWISLGMVALQGVLVVAIDGVRMMETECPASLALGRVGLYSYDSDGGLWFDDLVIGAP